MALRIPVKWGLPSCFVLSTALVLVDPDLPGMVVNKLFPIPEDLIVNILPFLKVFMNHDPRRESEFGALLFFAVISFIYLRWVGVLDPVVETHELKYDLRGDWTIVAPQEDTNVSGDISFDIEPKTINLLARGRLRNISGFEKDLIFGVGTKWVPKYVFVRPKTVAVVLDHVLEKLQILFFIEVVSIGKSRNFVFAMTPLTLDTQVLGKIKRQSAEKKPRRLSKLLWKILRPILYTVIVLVAAMFALGLLGLL